MNMIKRLLCITLALAALAFASSVQAQTQTLSVNVPLSPANEVPPVTGPADATGTAAITVTANLDNAGVITGGSVRFLVNATFPTPQGNVTGLHIHQAPVGSAGSIVVGTDVSNASGILASGTVTIDRTVSNVSSALIQSIISNPAGFYTNLHTTDNASGAIRGQLSTLTVAALTGITCQTICFQSPSYWAAQLAGNPFIFQNLPFGVIIIPGDNFFGPVLTNMPFKPFLLLYMLKPLGTLAVPTNPFLRLRRVFIAFQLSFLSGRFNKGAEPAILNSTLACHGITITPIVLSNGALITDSTALKVLLLQVELAVASNNAADMTALAGVFELLTAGSTSGRCQ